MNAHPGRVPDNHRRQSVRPDLVLYDWTADEAKSEAQNLDSGRPNPSSGAARARVVRTQRPPTHDMKGWTAIMFSEAEASPSPYTRFVSRKMAQYGQAKVWTVIALIALCFLIIAGIMATTWPAAGVALMILGIFWFLAIGLHPIVPIARTTREAIQNLWD